jgi:hypothetical protein
MLPWELLPGNIIEDAEAYFPTNRNDITSTGAKDHANVDTISDREIPDSIPPSSQSPQQLEDVNDDTSALSRATTTPPTEDVDVTSKRLASAELPDQPDLKKLKMSTPSDGDANGAGVEETDLLSSQHPQPLEHTVPDDNITSSATTTPPTEDSDATPKRSTFVLPTDQPDLKKIRMSTPLEGDEIGGGDDEIDLPSLQLTQQLEHTLADHDTTPRAENPQPQPEHTPADHDTTARAKTPQPTSTTNFNITPKRSASRPPADQPDPKRTQLFVPLKVNGGGSDGSISIRHAYILAKRHALAQPVDQPDTKKVWQFVPSDRSSGRGVWVDLISPSYPEVLRALKAAFGMPGGNASKPEQMEKDGVEGGVKGKIDENKVDKNKPGKDKLGQKKPGKDKVDSDSDGVEVIETKVVTPMRDWSKSAIARSASAKMSKGKKPGQLETPDAEDSPSARKSTAKASNSRGKTATRATTVDGSEAADEESEEDGEEDEDDEEESEYEDPKVAKKIIAQADKDLSGLCPKCKVKATRAWKKKHETEISQLKREHKAAMKILKDDAKADLTAASKKAKATAEKEKKAAKAKADELFENVKEACDEKLDTLKAKANTTFRELKESLAAEKAKVAELRLQVERVEAQRKKIEKDAAEKVKNAEADCKAEALRLKEEQKQHKRECTEQVYQLKPEHSKALKEKETVIKEIVQKYSKLELEFERSEDDLRLVREERSREKNHHEHTLQKLEEKRARVDELVGQLWEFERHNKAIKERALADVARVEEQLAIARDNHQQQSNRVVEKQRQNYQLGDAMRAHAKISEARKVEIEMLRKQLQNAQAELGIVKDIEELDDDVVEVGRREVVRGEVVKSEVIKGEAVKDEVIKGEAVKDEVIKGEAVKGEVV